MIIELSAPIPSKKNSRRNIRQKSGRIVSIPSESYERWHENNIVRVMAAAESGKMKGPLKITLEIGFQNRRRRDMDNALSSVLDLLVDGGVLPDDSWDIVPEMTVKGSLSKNSRAVVEISPI